MSILNLVLEKLFDDTRCVHVEVKNRDFVTAAVNDVVVTSYKI